MDFLISGGFLDGIDIHTLCSCKTSIKLNVHALGLRHFGFFFCLEQK